MSANKRMLKVSKNQKNCRGLVYSRGRSVWRIRQSHWVRSWKKSRKKSINDLKLISGISAFALFFGIVKKIELHFFKLHRLYKMVGGKRGLSKTLEFVFVLWQPNRAGQIRFAAHLVQTVFNFAVRAGGSEMPVYSVVFYDFQPESGHISSGNRSEERRVGKECRSRWSPYN